jgi:hypothetical protein
MMVPNLDPANPPVLWITRTEADLYRRMREAAKELPNL